MGLQQFEHRLERLVEGAFAKAFRGELQPIELGRRLTREMDLQRTVSVRGLIAPNVFRVVLSKDDYERLSGLLDRLARELAEAAKEHAHSERYLFVGPVEVEIGWNGELSKNSFAIGAEVVESEDKIGGHVVLPDGVRVPIADEPVIIGRLADCGVPISDPNVSRHHAQLVQEGDAVVLADLGSTNGTRVNGVPITRQRLNDGDLITVGKSSIRFETG